MDKEFPSRIPKSGKNESPSSPTNFEMYLDERMSKKKKKVVVKNKPRSGSPFTPTLFELPTSDKNSRYLPAPSEDLGKFQKYSCSQYGQPTDPRSSYDPYGQNVNYLPRRSKYDTNDRGAVRNNRLDNQGNMPQYNQETTQNQTSSPQPMYTNYKQSPNKPEKSESPQFNLNENPSLICRAVNYEGEPVKVNDEVIKDKLILSCRPRTFYGLGGYSKKPPLDESDRGQKYPYPPPQINVFENINNRTDIDIHQQYDEKVADKGYPETGKELKRTDAYDSGTLGLGDRGLEITHTQTQTDKYEEQYRMMQCKKYVCNFKRFLWALFIINVLLLLTGLTILAGCLHHMLFLDYMDTVLENYGFAIWIRVALALSLLIIIVAVFGITTAVTRHKRMIQCWILCAIVLIILIVIFLLVYWLTNDDLIEAQEKSMKKTFEAYRCLRNVRNAWDTLHEQYRCCGVRNRGDWKYIPPSCCQLVTKLEKLKCISHFISFEMAFNSGCRSKVEEYFTTFFLLITLLLVIAIVLLLLGIIVAWRLYKMYKVMLLCRDTYSVTS